MFWVTLRDALASLWSAKQRTLLATTGIVIGSGAVIAMINIGQIIRSEALAQFEKLGPNTVTLGIYGQGATVGPRAFEALVDEIPGVESAAPGIDATEEWYLARMQGNAHVFGTTEATFEIAGTRLAMGRC